MEMTIRKADRADVPALCAIYNYYVEHTVCSFEIAPVSVSEMETRLETVQNSDLPFYVGEERGKVVGFCYVHPWKSRAAYQATLETTIYLDPQYVGAGRGAALYERLLESVDRQRVHALIACITIPNPSSIRLHERMGFRQVSHFRAVGRKFGQWLDVGDWQLLLE